MEKPRLFHDGPPYQQTVHFDHEGAPSRIIESTGVQKPLLLPLAAGAWRVLYYDEPNRAEQLRLLFAFTNTPYEDMRIGPYPSGLDPFKSSNADMDSSPLAFDFVPVVQYGKSEAEKVRQVSISTTAGAMQYVGERLGLVPDDSEARAAAVMIVVGSEAMRNAVFSGGLQRMDRNFDQQ
jgi:hypothetical protein